MKKIIFFCACMIGNFRFYQKCIPQKRHLHCTNLQRLDTYWGRNTETELF